MRGLYLSNLNPQQSIGYMAKIQGQAKGLSQWGYDMDVITFSQDAEIVLYRYESARPDLALMPQVLAKAGKNLLIRRYWLLWHALQHMLLENYQFLYLRYPRSEPLYLYFLSRIRVRFPKLIVLSEFPTFPYDQEYKDATGLKDRLVVIFDKLTRRYLKYFIDRIVSINYDAPILGIPTISTDNGICTEAFPPIVRTPDQRSPTLKMIGVANVSPWHGYDRILRGLGQYYRQYEQPDCAVTLHIVGAKPPYIDGLRQIAEREGITHEVTFHPPSEGKSLDNLFHNCHLAIGVLGGHRKGLAVMSPLKNREYCARGIPFVFSHIDPDFADGCQYCLRIEADESAVEIERLIDFVERLGEEGEVAFQMREYASKQLDWSVKLKPVSTYIEEQIGQASFKKL